MKFATTQLGAALALTLVTTGAHAAAVVGLTLADTINASTGALGADGKSGAFRFAPINSLTYLGTSLFSGNVNGGVIDITQANAAGAFASGFLFAGAPFIPYTFGPIDMDITGGVLTVNSLPWGGNYAGRVNFNLPPDAGTLTVHNLIQTAANAYAYRIGWEHYITSTDDPSGAYVGFCARWIIEGTMTTVPEPETWAMFAAGLGLVGIAARRRRKPA